MKKNKSFIRLARVLAKQNASLEITAVTTNGDRVTIPFSSDEIRMVAKSKW